MEEFLLIFTLGLLTQIIAVPHPYLNPTDRDDCPRNNSLIVSLPNPTNCSRYYQCENGTKMEMTCPLNQQYNPVFGVCDDPKYAGCKENSSLNSKPLSYQSQNNTNTTQSPYSSLKPQTESQTTNPLKSDLNDSQPLGNTVASDEDTFKTVQNLNTYSTTIPDNINSTASVSLVTPTPGLSSETNVKNSTGGLNSTKATNITSSDISNVTLGGSRNISSSGIILHTVNETQQENLAGKSTPAAIATEGTKKASVTNGEDVNKHANNQSDGTTEDDDENDGDDAGEQGESKQPPKKF